MLRRSGDIVFWCKRDGMFNDGAAIGGYHYYFQEVMRPRFNDLRRLRHFTLPHNRKPPSVVRQTRGAQMPDSQDEPTTNYPYIESTSSRRQLFRGIPTRVRHADRVNVLTFLSGAPRLSRMGQSSQPICKVQSSYEWVWNLRQVIKDYHST